MNILSVQSHVAYGHAGNSAAVFPLQRLGCEVWPVHTVQFSNHTGYGDWKGRVFDGAFVTEVLDGIEARGVLPACDAVLSGYMGAPDIVTAVIAAAGRVKAVNADAQWCCDPVIGDVGRGVFVRPGIPELLRAQALPAADIVTPNQFELAMLTGRNVASLADLRAAVADLHAAGPRTVLVTSVEIDDVPADALDMAASDGNSLWRVRTPRLPAALNGAGDLVSALFLFHMLRSRSVPEALGEAASAVHAVLRRTVETGARELALVAAQEELVNPARRFVAEPA
ncbi:pyridoxal kinase PdxY [Alsobacter sp. SYSU M60028]|uniref:pyridoxal kinase n=1 Tax=Alsobacter ponti TaxID=2962936 RepID=A0ABT1L6Z6_9HYPH|nr:pyridoxal kinase PdxY [Alsobacter ponti]MCP8937217.1 pyridoxal kinase PdxY [Alsobacter ponti]